METKSQDPERTAGPPSSTPAEDSPAPAEYQYDAFISYSTRTDYNRARKIEAFLESFHRTPAPAGVALRRLQICRDGSDFTLPARRGAAALEQNDPVWGTIGPELGRSRYLLVLCSPGAVGSTWVTKEIGWFLEHRGAEWILAAVTEAADPGANPAECFPAALIEAGIHRRIFYDLRALGQTAGAPKVRNYEDELVRLASALLDWNADEHGPLASIWEREQLKRRKRQATIAIAVAAALAAAAVFAVWQALAATRQARRARANAIVQTADASFDPLTGALLLAELPREEEPAGGMNVAQKLASTQLPRAVLRGHTGAVKKVVFAPDQRHVLTASADGTARVWPTDGKGDPVILGRRGAPVLDAVFGPDGSLVATASEDKTARVWRVDGAGLVKEFSHADKVESVRFSFDGRWLLTAAGGKVALRQLDGPANAPLTLPAEQAVKRLWLSDRSLDGWAAAADGSVWAFGLDPQGAVTVREGPLKPPESGTPEDITFSPDGTRVALSFRNEVVVKRLDGVPAPLTLSHEEKVTSVCFNRDGSYIATTSADGKVRLWETGGGKLANVFDPKVHVWVFDFFGKQPDSATETALEASKALFSHDGSRLMSFSADGVVRIWDTANKAQPLELHGHLGADFAAFSDDDTQLVVGADDGTARVWSLAPPAEPLVLRHAQPIHKAPSFSRDGKKVLTASGEGVAHVWEVDTRRSVELDAHAGDVEAVVFNREATLVAAAYEDGRVRLWDITRAEGPSVVKEFGKSEETLNGVQFSPDERRLMAWSKDGAVRLWPLDGAGSPSVLESSAGNVWDAEFSPDGGRVLATYEDGTARVWSADGSGKVVLLGGPEGHSRTVFNGAFSPDGTRVLTVSGDGTARIWHSDGSERPLVFNGADPEEWLEQCAYSPTGETFATTSSSGRVWVWRADGKGRPVVLRTIYDLAHNGPVTSVEFSPDGRRLVTSGGIDVTVRVWQLDGGGQSVNLVGHLGPIAKASFSADGARVLSAAEDGTARVWRARWPDLIEGLRGVTTATLTVEQRMTLLGETEQEAREAYEAAERAMGRTPLPADWRFDYPGF